MNINYFDINSFKIVIKQLLATFLIIVLSLIIILLLVKLNNETIFEYEGMIINPKTFQITNLSYLDLKTILESELIILDNKISKDNIIIEKKQDNYQLQIKLDELLIPGDILKLSCHHSKESLFQFIKNTMKGDT